MTTTIALFTRNLRIHDNPVLVEAARADRVVPLFVFDDHLLASAFNRPNRTEFLLQSLNDLDHGLRSLGVGLVVRRGDTATEVARVAEEVAASRVHVARDVSAFSASREEALGRHLDQTRCSLQVHDAVITAHPPGDPAPTGNDHYAVFTPYFRQWEQRPLRAAMRPPKRLQIPAVSGIEIPQREHLCSGAVSPEVVAGGETEGRSRMHAWLSDDVHDYGRRQDDMAADGSSGLSPYLHFGCVSPVEMVQGSGRSEPERAFVRQVAWRDFHHQVLAARPRSSWHNYRDRHDQWRHDADALQAWRDGVTGVPIVDAGMRQLARQGWMHNRARLIVGSFLTKTLYIDWRVGAQHFLDLLVDGDIANNNLNWQWVAGTGTDTRPNRVLNPIRQAQRYDPDGDYIRRFVPELADLPTRALHDPVDITSDQRSRRGYPAPIVDLDEARERFLAARGKA